MPLVLLPLVVDGLEVFFVGEIIACILEVFDILKLLAIVFMFILAVL